jgi:hypothetical protein
MRFSLALCCLVVGAPFVGAQELKESLRKLPDWVNALVIMDYQNVLASPLAQREGWDKLSPMEAFGCSLPYLRNTKTVVQAAHLEPGTLRSQRDIVLVKGGPFATLTELAKQEKGVEETIGGNSAILTGKNAFIVSLSPTQLAVTSPAHRQDTARWLRFASANREPVLSSYLVQAADAMKDGYHIVIALDLHDAIDPHLVRRYLQHTPLLKDKNVDREALVKVLSGSRGIRIGIRFDQAITANLAADFSDNIQGVAATLPALVMGSLDNMGGELEEFPLAKAQIQEKSFLISTSLSVKGLRQLLRLVPSVSGPVLAPRDVAFKGIPVDNQVANNQAYFRNIRDLANDAHNAAEKKNDMIAAAKGYERAARQIDQLPVAGIDEDLVRFSTTASSRLRAIADALREVVLEATAVEGGRRSHVEVIPGTYLGYNLGPWNPSNPGDPFSPGGLWIRPMITPPTFNVITNDNEIQAKQQVILARGAKRRLELWRQLSDESANLRKKLSIKYRVDF